MENPLVMLRTAYASRSALQRITADGVPDVQRALRRGSCRKVQMTTTRLLDRRAVEVMTGLSRSAIYAAMNDGTFPKPIRIGTRGVRWFEHEVLDWIARRVCGARVVTPMTSSLPPGWGWLSDASGGREYRGDPWDALSAVRARFHVIGVIPRLEARKTTGTPCRQQGFR